MTASLKDAISTSGRRLYDLAGAANVSYTTLRKFVIGERELSMGELNRICRALDLELRRKVRKAK